MYLDKVLLLFLIIIASCQQPEENTLFRQISSAKSGIDFSNDLTESYGYNMLLFSNYYTGGGVGIIDINNDNLPDVIMGGNQVSSRLYLNKGDLKFEDITEQAGLTTDRWITGISVVDINSDGYEDIYLSVSGLKNISSTQNQLFINNGDNTFTDRAEEYGLGEQEQTTHTSFFDYDQDGDLDAFMAINPSDFSLFYMGRIKKPRLNGESRSTDKLFENLGNGKFQDVSKKAGILAEGYSLGVNTSDFNSDGLTDIFVSNDFVYNDLLYINNGDGTFRNELKSMVDVSSYASMGNDAADINNDGTIDLITLDMLPEDSYREKILVPSSNFNTNLRTLKLGYHPQFTRNMLHINNGDGTFSEIGQMAGISRTDWSWSSLFMDLDNDGYKDLFVSNGFRRELGNLDYINYNEFSPFTNPGADIQGQIDGINNTPGIPLANYVYKNNGDLTFTNTVKEWGFELPTYSNGVVMSDLDLDGDLDIVINNIDMQASVYENLSDQKLEHHYLDILLTGYGQNMGSIGTRIILHHDQSKQVLEINPYRGYLSSVENQAHFGLGDNDKVDSIKVYWPDGKSSLHKTTAVDTVLTLSYPEASAVEPLIADRDVPKQFFSDITSTSNISFKHRENKQIDFHKQFLLPHQHSKLGPGIAVGDVNGDGIDDCYVGGAHGQSGQLFIQLPNATFQSQQWAIDDEYEDMGALIFDYDGDGDNDLYVASGGTHADANSPLYQDRLYLNDGRGKFKRTTGVLPDMYVSSSSVSASDFDKDGDLDLFVGGRIVPGEYPSIPQSFLLRNDGGAFVNIIDDVAPELGKIGMVTQGLWTDYDNDEDIDLLVVGEWMPATLYEYEAGRFNNKTADLQLNSSTGWWNSIVGSDFDHDGHMDYILGNYGTNNNYDASVNHPLELYSKDFDNNGSIDPILSKNYVDGSHPIISRDQFLGQLAFLKSTYTSYESYAATTTKQLFSEEDWDDVSINNATTLETSILMNYGGDSLQKINLPQELQLSPIFAGVSLDIDGNGQDEILLSGNFYSNNASSGPLASSTGALVEYINGQTIVSRGHTIGIDYRGDRKSLVAIKLSTGDIAMISAVNDGELTLHKVNSDIQTLPYEAQEYRARIRMTDGTVLMKESYYGSSYLSHSSRILILPNDWQEVTFIDYSGEERRVLRQINN